ncbi:hypothetical protein HID58_086978, partial [Brassica napus]
FRAVILHIDLAVGWFVHNCTHDSSISVVGSFLHHDETVIENDAEEEDGNPDPVDMEVPKQHGGPVVSVHTNQEQAGDSAIGSHVGLLQNFWSHAPMEEVQKEYERRVGVVRTKRRNDFIDSLLEESTSSHQNQGTESHVKEEVEKESDEDSDHVILEWEARRYADVDVSQYGSFLQDDTN